MPGVMEDIKYKGGDMEDIKYKGDDRKRREREGN